MLCTMMLSVPLFVLILPQRREHRSNESLYRTASLLRQGQADSQTLCLPKPRTTSGISSVVANSNPTRTTSDDLFNFIFGCVVLHPALVYTRSTHLVNIISLSFRPFLFFCKNMRRETEGEDERRGTSERPSSVLMLSG